MPLSSTLWALLVGISWWEGWGSCQSPSDNAMWGPALSVPSPADVLGCTSIPCHSPGPLLTHCSGYFWKCVQFWTGLHFSFIENVVKVMRSFASLIKFLLHRKFCSALCHETTLELLCQLWALLFKDSGSYLRMRRANSLDQTLMLGKIEGRRRRGRQRTRWLDGIIGQWTWAWASSRRRWRAEKPGVLQSMGSQRVGHDWATEKQQQQISTWWRLLEGQMKN